MFQPGFVESENSEIVLKDFDADTLASLLEFIYTAKITITEENAQVRITKRYLSKFWRQDILIGANLLLLYPVREAAGEVVGRLIDCNNVLLIRFPFPHLNSLSSILRQSKCYSLGRWPVPSPAEKLKLELTTSFWRGLSS